MSRPVGLAALLLVTQPLAILLLPVLVPPAQAAPPDGREYRATIRFQIGATGNERVRQHRALTEALTAGGFRRDADDLDPDEATDPNHTRLRGVLPARATPAVLRQPAVRTVLLSPADRPAPDKGPVRVDVTLAGGLTPANQLALHRQAGAILAGLGFVPGVGYDHRDHTRLVGALPAEQLGTLLADLRDTPAAREARTPLPSAAPVRLVVARPDLPLPSPRPAAPSVPADQARYSAELRALLADPARAARPARLEVLLDHAPLAQGNSTLVRQRVRDLEGSDVDVEGLTGNLALVRGAPAAIAPRLARLPHVVGIRLPHPAREVDDLGRFVPLLSTGPARLLDARASAGRIALVGADFTGWEALRPTKPVELIDLTALDRPELLPAPPTKGGPEGAGTRAARGLLRAIPGAALTLIRVDPASPAPVEEAARAIAGDLRPSLPLERRLREIERDRADLELRRDRLQAEREAALGDTSEGDAALKRREAYQQSQKAFDTAAEALQLRTARFLALRKQLAGLKGVRLAALTLDWSDGFPEGSPLAFLDERPFRAALWFRPPDPASREGAVRVWTGALADANRDGVLEFGRPGEAPPAGSWTPDLKFLAWRPRGEAPRAELPAGARLRVTLQRREAHDPTPLRAGEDPYRTPLARFRLVLLRQFDPKGAARPADDLAVVAESVGPAVRLTQTAYSAVYEQTVELTAPAAGRYAVRVEGELPATIHPPGEAVLPGQRQAGEVRPRLEVWPAGEAEGGQAEWLAAGSGR